MYMVILKDGRYFTAGNEGDGILSACIELQDRELITSDYEIYELYLYDSFNNEIITSGTNSIYIDYS